ncbi:GIY-YIG nuclease family protein [Butyrivibrio sp.]|uniref:GIY-YIG nuclease family protein n=1 Tax=Butyrivibrio sp. TaxID=28121 RepID=UPI0025C5394D|nr:GIY-YIG nuclease family protein [Butyrivibrio sp.]MBE5838369.1 GIY-YIG nuclease family protein [Butyrivibrio sp.]
MENYTFFLSDVIEKTGIDHDKIALIRHTPKSHKNFRQVWEAGMDCFEEYQKIQPKNYFHGKEYIFSFVGETKSTARFIAVYKVNASKNLSVSDVNPIYWKRFGNIHSKKDDYFYDLEKLNILEDLQDRLVIDYGGTRNIVHVNWNTIANKPVVGISSRVFEGCENIIWRFSDLEKYIGHEEIYGDLYTALSSVNGVYLIVDTVDFSQYIGSAYGSDGIWGRWKDYLRTKGTGNNKKLKEHLDNNPDRYKSLQFTILETIPRTGNEGQDKKFAQQREAWFKKKLMTRNEETGLNMN